MKRTLLILFQTLLFSVYAGSVWAQNADERFLRGKVYDADRLDPLPGATVQVYDSLGTFLGGGVTNEEGVFRVGKLLPQKYNLKISFMGYKQQSLRVDLSGKRKELRLKDILLHEAVYEMDEAQITAQGRELVLRDDTLVYYADYYRLPPGARMAELLRRMPGVYGSDDQDVRVNGKKVARILINGKEFFGDDLSMALKYLPAELIKELKVYDKKSDESEWMGVDDGSRETVIDLTVADDFQNSWVGEVEAAYGSSNRYIGKASVNNFQDKRYTTLMAQAGNDSQMGDENNQNVGWSFNRSGKKLDLGGNLSYNRNEMKQDMASSMESFENTTAAFTETMSRMYNRNQNLHAGLNVEWRPDSMTVIRVAPMVSWTNGWNTQESFSASFSSDPYRVPGVEHPLEQMDLLTDTVAVNANRGLNGGENNFWSAQMSLNVTRRFAKKGRSLMLGINGGYTRSDNNRDEFRQIDYYRLSAIAGGDSVYHQVQYDKTPNTNTNWGSRLTYSEPLGRDLTLLLTYQVSLRRQEDRREVASIQDPRVLVLGVNHTNYSDFYQDALPDTLQSRNTCNDYLEQRGEIGLNLNKTKYQLNAGLLLNSQLNRFTYQTSGRNFEAENSTINWAPQLNFYYHLTSREQINCSYYAMARPVDAQKLIPDTLDFSNPLNLELGNPDLKPSFTHMISMGYNRFTEETMRSYNVHVSYMVTQNSLSSQSTYDTQTGRRTMIPVNVDGNMNGTADFMMNAPLKNKKFTFLLQTNVNYMRYVGFVVGEGAEQTVRNVTNQVTFRPTLRLSYRDDLWDCFVSVGGNYDHSRSTALSAGNMDTYGLETRCGGMVQMPWGMDFSTDFTLNARWGFSFQDMNNNEWIWNMQLSQGFLKGRKARVALKVYDLLNGRNYVSRSFSSSMRSDVHYEAFGRYVMLHLSYNFSLFRKKK